MTTCIPGKNAISATIPKDNEDNLPRCSRRSRRLQRHLRRRQDCDLNIVSMIDVFAVIVFFLLFGSSVSASRLYALKLEFAATQEPPTTQVDNQPRQLTITLLDQLLLISDRDGTIARIPQQAGHDNTGALSEQLAAIRAQRPQEKRLTLRVSDAIRYDRIVAVMDAAREFPGQPGSDMFPLIAIGNAPSQETSRP